MDITTKKCTKCFEVKDFGEFYRQTSTKDGLTCQCKACTYTKKIPKVKTIEDGMKKCSRCGDVKVIEFFSKHRREKDGLNNQCKVCDSKYRNKEKIKANHRENREKRNADSRQWRLDNPGYKVKIADWKLKFCRDNPEQYLLTTAKTRAKNKGLEFNLEAQHINIPNNCPVLGIKLVAPKGALSHRPSLDRVNNSKGYIANNVQVISHRANALKRDATPQESLDVAYYNAQYNMGSFLSHRDNTFMN